MSQRYTKLGIHLKVKDFNKSLAFYLKLGFVPIFAFGSEAFRKSLPENTPSAEESYNGIIFSIGDAVFEIAEGHIAVKPQVFKEMISSSKVSAMIYVDSLEPILEICKRESYEIAAPTREFKWGTREVVVRDPDGFILVFIQKLKN